MKNNARVLCIARAGLIRYAVYSAKDARTQLRSTIRQDPAVFQKQIRIYKTQAYADLARGGFVDCR